MFTSDGYSSGYQQAHSDPPQHTYTQVLELQLAESRTQVRELEKGIRTLQDNFASLLDVVERKLIAMPAEAPLPSDLKSTSDVAYYHTRDGTPILFGPPIVKIEVDDCDVQYYTDGDWKKYIKSDAGKKAAEDWPHGQPYMELDGGEMIDNDTSEAVRKFAHQLYHELLDKGLQPQTWSNAPSGVLQWFYARMEHEFPFLRMCANHWKSHKLPYHSYSSWHGTHVRSKAGAATKSEPQDTPLTSNQSANTPSASASKRAADSGYEAQGRQKHRQCRNSSQQAPSTPCTAPPKPSTTSPDLTKPAPSPLSVVFTASPQTPALRASSVPPEQPEPMSVMDTDLDSAAPLPTPHQSSPPILADPSAIQQPSAAPTSSQDDRVGLIAGCTDYDPSLPRAQPAPINTPIHVASE
ncbi:hypothetical protein EV122DRAFT_250193 [Schizophyllum commune]